MKSLNLFASLLLSTTACAWAQNRTVESAGVEVGPQHRVGADLPMLPHVEPVLAINPRDPDHLVAAAIVVQEPLSDRFSSSWTVHVLVSRDGGASWTRRPLPGLDRGPAGDPWLAWAEAGTLYLSCLGQVEGSGGRFVAVLYRSADGGLTWSGPERIPNATRPNGSTDHPVIRTVGNRLHVFTTGPYPSISVTRTQADGSGFETLPPFSPDDGNNDNLGSGVPFADGRFVFSYYSVSVPQPSPHWAVRFEGGDTGYQRVAITDEHIPVAFPMMTVDRSGGPRHDRVYAVWTRSFTQPHVMLAYSDDYGASWSEPLRVHADASPAFRFIPNVAVGDAGEVAVVWIDGRHHDGVSADRMPAHLQDESAVDCWDIYAAVSRDGGETFLPEIRLTPETTCSDAAGNGAAGRRWRYGGDYIGITWDANGGFHPIWADSRTGAYQLWTTRVQVK